MCSMDAASLVGAISPLPGADDGVERRSCPRGSTLRHVDHPRITPLELPRAWLTLDGRLLHASLRPCDEYRSSASREERHSSRAAELLGFGYRPCVCVKLQGCVVRLPPQSVTDARDGESCGREKNQLAPTQCRVLDHSSRP